MMACEEFPVYRDKYLLKLVQGKTTGKRVAGSQAAGSQGPKAQYCAEELKAILSGQIHKRATVAAIAIKVNSGYERPELI